MFFPIFLQAITKCQQPELLALHQGDDNAVLSCQTFYYIHIVSYFHHLSAVAFIFLTLKVLLVILVYAAKWIISLRKSHPLAKK